MKNRQKLWIISEIFYPDQTTTAYILTEIAKFMSKYYDVQVLSGPIGYDRKNVANSGSDDLKDIHVYRSSCLIKNKNNLVLRTLRQIILTFKFAWNFFLKVSSKDKVLLVTNPAPLLFIMALLRTIKHVNLIILVHDVFPENTLPAGIFKTPDNCLYRLIKTCFSWAYAQANQLIVLGRDMQEVIQTKIKNRKNKPQISIVENWADIESIYPLKREKCLSVEHIDKIILGYAGNYGRVQGILRLLQIAKNTRNKMLYFRFWGNGAMRDEMKKFVSDHNLENVEINDGYKRSQQLDVLNSCDVAFVSLETGMYGLGVPSKTYNILAAGKPVIFIGDPKSEIGQLIIENDIGWVFNGLDNKEIESFLEHLGKDQMEDLEIKKQRCRYIAETKYAKNIILEKFYSVIQ